MPAQVFIRARLPLARLTVTIITKNEARHITDCIRSARFADEVVVVDCGSTDDTVALARAAGAIVHEMDWAGDGPQKNRAIDRASGDWFFSLDADERIPPELATEIRRAIEQPSVDAFRVPRLSAYCGQFMRHGGWWPDLNVRLGRRGKARYTETEVHATIRVEGATADLQSHLVHYSFPDLESVVDKLNRYSSAGARDMAARGKEVSFSRAVASGWWAFMRTYFLQAGFLDGRRGFMLAVSNAEGTYYRYLKRWLMQQGPGPGHAPAPGRDQGSSR